MENLINDFRQMLIQRKMNELRFIETLNCEADLKMILVSTGKIFELDFLIQKLDILLEFQNKYRSS